MCHVYHGMPEAMIIFDLPIVIVHYIDSVIFNFLVPRYHVRKRCLRVDLTAQEHVYICHRYSYIYAGLYHRTEYEHITIL